MAHGARHLDGVAGKEHGKPFAGCTGEQQDAILKLFVEGGFKAGKFDGSVFFRQLMELTLEGYLSDPKYGGNRNRAGWRVIGIPDGLRSCWWNPHGVEMVLSPDSGFQD
jgi:gluconate 2-dehydrogenase gamma chain